ncbi:MAG: hypothetical protein VB859_00445, partial [Planctomycetaceae bacterium]
MTHLKAFIYLRVLLCAAILTVLLSTGCGYLHYAGPLRPQTEQPEAMVVADDGSVTYEKNRFEVKLRPLSDAELNRQFATESQQG